VGAAIAAIFAAQQVARAGGSIPTNQPRITISGRCPRHPLSLPGEAVARAADQARIEAPAIYGNLGTNAKVVAADLATTPNSGPRGQQVRRQCGPAIAAETVVVSLFLPRGLPSASLSQGTVLVSRLAIGYQVWEVAH
jgi:hypothetical protein